MKTPFILFLVTTLAGCALTSKGDALAVRWYNPETIKPRLTGATSGEPDKAALAIELGRVTSGGNLRELIAYRDTAYEVGYFDDKRWTERPEVFVERALARTLFEEKGLRRALAGQAPVLDVEVLSFEMLTRGRPAARIQLRMLVHDDRDALLERTLTVERQVPKGETGFDSLVRAMAEALDEAAREVAKDAIAVLQARKAEAH